MDSVRFAHCSPHSAFVQDACVNFEPDLQDSVRYLNLDAGLVPKELVSRVRECPGNVPLHEGQKGTTNYVASSLSRNGIDDLSAYVLRAESLRKFLG